ncbi:MAG TPA: competence protein CoiA family protein [Pseudogracilibacillus sp.]|nr:competence protein CoiA family protein [Pseudogracilibacillus sp.]
MLEAIDQAGQIVSIAHLQAGQLDDLKRHAQFICPDCKQAVMIRYGPYVTPHFAHYADSNCSHAGESSYHEKAKVNLANWLKAQGLPAQVEHYIAETKQMADVFTTVNKKAIALEFQHSIVPASQIISRTKKYLQAGIYPLWIVSMKLMPKRGQLTQFLRHFIHQFHDSYPPSLYFYCPDQNRLTIWQHIYLIHHQCFRTVTHHHLRKLHLPDLFASQPFPAQALWQMWAQAKRKFRLHRPLRLSKRAFHFRNALYEKGYYIDYLPSLIHLPVSQQMLIQAPIYEWQTNYIVYYFNDLPNGAILDLNEGPSLRSLPLIQTSLHPLEQYLTYLQAFQYVELNRAGDYVKKQSIPFYESLESAINGDLSLFRDKKKVQLLHKLFKNSVY